MLDLLIFKMLFQGRILEYFNFSFYQQDQGFQFDYYSENFSFFSKALWPITRNMVFWISNYIMTWLLCLYCLDLLTASIKRLVSFLAKLQLPTPNCPFTSNQIRAWLTACAGKLNKRFPWFLREFSSWICLVLS